MSLLSGMYGRAARFRRSWYGGRPYRMRRLAQPVVSVGNLTVGGTGKTPAVAALARLLIAAGERPAILTRGYGRRRAADGVVVVSDGCKVLVPTRKSGDEPQMLARALSGVPVLVSADRYLAGRLAERTFGCTLHLLDDGFQHVQLTRDIDLLVISAADLDERLLPGGRLREPLEAAAAADALLVSGTQDAATAAAAADDVAAVVARLGVTPVFRVVPRYEPLRLVESRFVESQCVEPSLAETPFLEPQPASSERVRRVVAVAGIARPERFLAALSAEGLDGPRDGPRGERLEQHWDVVREIVFRDHHWFSRRDLAVIQQAAVDTGADLIVTTEKDAMRLDAASLGSSVGIDAGVNAGVQGISWAFLPQQVAIEPSTAFAAWLHERLGAARVSPRPDKSGEVA